MASSARIVWALPGLIGYYDPSERKYYITPQSVETAIQEEIQRIKNRSAINDPEPFGSAVARVKHSEDILSPSDVQNIQELKWEILDLKITNREKEYLIGELIKERKVILDQLLSANRTMGQLEAMLNQLNDPKLNVPEQAEGIP